MLPRPLAMGIVVLVSIVWAANFFARLFVPGYEPDISINGIFMVLVGGALIASRKAREPGAPPEDTPVELPPGVTPPPGVDQVIDLDEQRAGRHRREQGGGHGQAPPS